MARLDERLRTELERLSPPADPTGVVDRVLRRGARRYALHRVGIVALAFALAAGSTAGIYGLSRVFGGDERRPREPAAVGPDVSLPTAGNGDLVFASVIGRSAALFRVSPDGSGLQRLTPAGAATYTSPDASPDGRHVVVVHRIPGFDPGESVLATVPIGGGAPTWLTPGGWIIADPAWSPEGGRIVFAGSPGGPYGIYVLEIATGEARLVPGTDQIDVASPTWSPDGSRVAFQGSTDPSTDPDQRWDIYSVRLDGSEMENLTRTSDSSEIMPAWSWALDRMAFISIAPAEADLLTMAPDGTDLKTVYSGELAAANPTWSPDGAEIAFEGGSEGIKTIRADGTGFTAVPGARGFRPAWLPVPPGESTPPTSPTESRTVQPQDIGLAFPVCNVSSVVGRFAPGITGTAYVATKMSDVGGCPDPWTADNVIAVDVDADGQADATHGPFVCGGACRTFATPDLDGDGISEIAVVTNETAAAGDLVGLFRVTVVGANRVTITQFETVDQGGRTAPTQISWGVSGPETSGAWCTIADAGPELVAWTADRNADGTFEVGGVFFLVEGSRLANPRPWQHDQAVDESGLRDLVGNSDVFCGSAIQPS